MKKLIFCTIFILVCMQATFAQHKENKMLRHVVMFGWKAGTDSNAIQKIVQSFKALPGKINQIKGFEYGTNNSPEKLNNGLTHCFLLTFSSTADRDAYLIHPAHKEFGAQLVPKPDHITVLDYWVEK